MQCLEEASVDGDIESFARFLLGEIKKHNIILEDESAMF